MQGKHVLGQNRSPIIMCPSIAVPLFALSLLLPAMSRAQEPDLSSLSWLAGCWAAESGEAGSGEQWMPLAGGTMLGIGRVVKKGKTVEYEFLQIRANTEGKIVYIALPSKQREASFVVSDLAEGTVTFENLQHDFPQRIMYRRLPDERLAARIEGLSGGNLRGIDYPMKRVSCEALAGQPIK